jgi:phosphoglycolate phosphatase
MTWRRRFDAVLFDLDGTLVETAPDLCTALNHCLVLAGRPPVSVAEVRHMVGDGARALLRRGLAAASAPPAEAEVEHWFETLLGYYREHVADASHPFEGVVGTLDRMQAAGSRHAVCTNKPIQHTRALLDALDLTRRFEVVVGGDSLGVRKPHPQHLLSALETMGVAPSRAAMVGDSANDVAAARAAGLPVVVVSFGYTAVPPGELGGDALIHRFADLPDALAALA